MTLELSCYEIEPSTDSQLGTVIWLHGLGATSQDFVPVVPYLHLPEIRFVFPQAPDRPVTLNGGMVMPSWYDIRTLEETANRESEEDIRSTAKQIATLINREIDKGIPAEKIILAGFSQGGALAMHVALRFEKMLAGIMALSTYMVLPETLSQEALGANALTPLLTCHGTLDEVVSIDRGRRAYDDLRAFCPERDSEWHTFPMGHEVCIEQIKVIARWMWQRFEKEIPTIATP